MDVDHEGNEDVVSRYTGDGAGQDGQAEPEEEEVPRNPANAHLKFRNYVPHDRALRKHHVRKAPANIVSELEEQLQLEMAIVDDEELLQEASKESNWDLKRELSDKVAIMDAATQVALSQLLRLKMAAN